VPALGLDGAIAPMAWNPPSLSAEVSGSVGYPITDFYLTNAICRASPTMQRCSAEITHGQEWAEAAE
jgi:NADH-quinone oxidoreductase subunit G